MGIKQAVLEDHTVRQLEHYVFLLYQPGTTLVNELRWCLFQRTQAEAERLPPAKAALILAIKRALFQRIVWYKDTFSNPNIPSEYGWREEAGGFSPVLTTMYPAPGVILQPVKCACT